MKRLIYILLCLLVAGLAGAEGIGTQLPKTGEPGYSADFDSGDSAGYYVLGASLTSITYNFERGSGFLGELYDCDTVSYVAATCDLLTTLNADVTGVKTTKRRWLIVHIATAESANFISTLVVKGGWQIGGGGGLTSDNDGDGLYESAYLWDADGDGSGKVTCTDKDAPDPACKVAGEIIYRDFDDDMNCAMWGCGFGQMENTGTVHLEDGVSYVSWPCWNATPTGAEVAYYNTPAPADESRHDETTDGAFINDCPLSPSGTRQLGGLTFMDWQGSLVGAGVDNRDSALTVGYKRDKGSYLVDDRGPTWESGASLNGNSWWGSPAFTRGFGFGFQQAGSGAGLYVPSGEDVHDGDSKGATTVLGAQTIGSLNGSICVASASFATSLVVGDMILVTGNTADLSWYGANDASVSYLRVRDVPSTVCNTTGRLIPVGGFRVGGTGADYSVDPASIISLRDGATVTHARSDYMDSRATVSNVTITSQDSWNEPGGDCTETGLWTIATDGASTDIDCDTNPFIGFYGGGYPILKDSVIRNWHQYSFDGDVGGGLVTIDNVQFLFGNGGPIADISTAAWMKNTNVSNSQFSTTAIGLFAPGITIDGITVNNSSMQDLITFNGWNTMSTIRGVSMVSTNFKTIFNFANGARMNSIDGVVVTGCSGGGAQLTNGVVALFSSFPDTLAPPIFGNIIRNVLIEGNCRSSGAGTSQDIATVQFFNGNTVGDNAETKIVGNTFENFKYTLTDNVAGTTACLFGISDETEADRTAPNYCTGAGAPLACCTGAGAGAGCVDDYGDEEIFTKNYFTGSSVWNRSSPPGTVRIYCSCAQGTDPANFCDRPIKGSGAGGFNPIGCGNFENDALPADQDCM